MMPHRHSEAKHAERKKRYARHSSPVGCINDTSISEPVQSCLPPPIAGGSTQPIHFFPTLLTVDEVVQVNKFILELIAKRQHTIGDNGLCTPTASPSCRSQQPDAYFIASDAGDEPSDSDSVLPDIPRFPFPADGELSSPEDLTETQAPNDSDLKSRHSELPMQQPHTELPKQQPLPNDIMAEDLELPIQQPHPELPKQQPLANDFLAEDIELPIQQPDQVQCRKAYEFQAHASSPLMFAPRISDKHFTQDFANSINKYFDGTLNLLRHLESVLANNWLSHSHSRRTVNILLEEHHLLTAAPLVCKADFNEVASIFIKEIMSFTQRRLSSASVQPNFPNLLDTERPSRARSSSNTSSSKKCFRADALKAAACDDSFFDSADVSKH